MREVGRWCAAGVGLGAMLAWLAHTTEAAPTPPAQPPPSAPARPGPAAVPAAPAGAHTFDDLRERGRKAYRAGRFEEARDLWADAFALRLDDAETAADLALAYQHTNQNDRAIETNRDAIRLASTGKLDRDKAQRIRRGAYYNLGKLRAKREIRIGSDDENDGPSTCVRLESEPGCKQPVFACGRLGSTGGRDGLFEYTAARFALRRSAARIVEDGQLVPGFDSWVEFGYQDDATHDRADAISYDVTLDFSSEARKPMPGEPDVVFARENSGCDVVHVDACARRLGLYCAWGEWNEDGKEKGHAKAVELTFARKAPAK